MNENSKPFAVITGATDQLGMELAKQFASHGYDLLITSPSDSVVNAEEELRALGVEVTALEVDLGTFQGTEKLYRAIKSFERPLDTLILNAVNGVSGEFTETDLKREIHLINHNIISSVHLTKLILKDMFEQGSGRILFASSIPVSSFAPLEPVFESSMAFLMTFTESLQVMAREKGVTITTMMPVEGEEHIDEKDFANVAREGYEALMAGRTKVFEASLKSKLQSWASQIIPDKFKTEFQRRVNEANTPQ